MPFVKLDELFVVVIVVLCWLFRRRQTITPSPFSASTEPRNPLKLPGQNP